MKVIDVYFDGACEPQNPGGYATWGWVGKLDGKIINTSRGCVGHGEGMTNNVAEYHAILDVLRHIRTKSAALIRSGYSVRIFGDSQLVVRQVQGEWNCNAAHLQPLLARAMVEISDLMREGLSIQIDWVSRDKNEDADKLSKQAYREAKVLATQ